MSARDRVIVVGGGAAGLSLAEALSRRGVEVLVLEAEARAGGLIWSERKDGYLCEHGANAFLDDGESGAPALARRLGVEVVPASPAAKRRWIWRGGRLRVVPTSPPLLFKSDLISWRGKLRLFAEPLVGRGAVDENETVDAFFRRRLGHEAASAMVAPFVTGVFAGQSSALSMAAAFPTVWELESRHGGLVRGMIKRRKNGERDAKAERRPKGLVSPPEGAEAISRALLRELGQRVRTGARVTAIDPRGAGDLRVRVGADEWLDARAVVLATPAPASAALLRPHDPRLAELLQTVPQAHVAVAFAGFPRRAVSHPLDGFGALVADDEVPRALGVVFETTVWPDRAPAGHVLLRLIYGGARDPQAARLDDAGLRAQVAEDLRLMFAITARPSFFHVVRPPAGLPQYTPGHLARVAEIERRAAALHLTMTGNALRGVSVNDLIKHGERLAEGLAGSAR